MLLLIAACSGPRDADVRAEFLRAHPGASVESVGAGEGDGDHAYVHVRYRAAGDSALREAVWLYVRQADGAWRNTRRDSAGAARP